MTRRIRSFVLLSSLLATGAILACDDTDSRTAIAEPDPSTAHALMDAEANSLVAAVREATAHLHEFENAAPSGWDLQVTDCKEGPEGGMGYHFGHMGYYLDGEANELEPEILLYAPQPNGQRRLVAVEYIVPAFAWEGSGTPTVFGQEMEWVEAHGEWELHAWIWQHNPNGMFAGWNPLVSCEHAG